MVTRKICKQQQFSINSFCFIVPTGPAGFFTTLGHQKASSISIFLDLHISIHYTWKFVEHDQTNKKYCYQDSQRTSQFSPVWLQTFYQFPICFSYSDHTNLIENYFIFTAGNVRHHSQDWALSCIKLFKFELNIWLYPFVLRCTLFPFKLS